MNAKSRHTWILTCVILSLCLCSCREIEEPGKIGLEYYPLIMGSQWTYQIDSTAHDPFSNDTIHKTLYCKLELARNRIDAAGRLVYEIDIYQSDQQGIDWKYKNSMRTFKSSFLVEENRENIKVVPLVFPVKLNKVWDGNQLNNKGRQAFVYKVVDQPFTEGQNHYSNSLKVERVDDSTSFDQQRSIEHYGKNVGLIYKEDINFTTQNNKKSGTKVIWRLLEYKN